jgi:hypothetical protein
MAVILSVFFLGAGSVQAQVAHTGVAQPCGCPECAGSGGLFSGVCDSLHQALCGLNPCHIGSDARHKIYKAALVRNTFDKKCLLPLPYYPHILPCYRRDRCCCGPLTTAPCPECYPEQAWEGEATEIYEDPQAIPMELESQTDLGTPALPNATVTPKEAQMRAWQSRSAARAPRAGAVPAARKEPPSAPADRVAEERPAGGSSLRDFIQFVGGAKQQPTGAVRPVSGVQPVPQSSATAANPLR